MTLFGKEIHRPKWIPRWISLTFVIFAVFLVMLLFYGPNNYLKVTEYKKQVKELKTEIKANEDSTKYYEAKTRELNTDRASLERIAREKYGMKRDGEEVYITPDIP